MRNRFLFIAVIVSLQVILSASLPSTESPMAKLMRQMLLYIKTEKINIASNAPRQTYPEHFKKIHKAKITPGKKLSTEHEEFKNSFLKELDNYYAAEPSNRQTVFNSMINTCITCHEHECPGPISTIKSNLLN
jgi:hypothetical protein